MPSTDETKRFRYPRTQPFEDSELDRRVFFGRKVEISELFQRIMSTKLLVLYGRSGLGKTSILQAGVFPRLRKQKLLPITVRVNDPDRPPIEILQAAVEKACQAQGIDYTPGSGSSFWEFFKTAVFWHEGELQSPILILDQFEEIFTLHNQKSRSELIKELGELMTSQLPESLRARRQAGEQLPYSDKPPMVKIVLSLRESYLGELEELTTELPQIMSDRYRLTAMDRRNATDAIVEPARLDQKLGYITQPFEYTAGALADMLDFLADQGDEIEPFALQLLCAHIERKIVAPKTDRESEITIHHKDIGSTRGMEKILEEFYEDVLSGQKNRRERKHARRLCSEGLLSPEGRRLSLEEEHVIRTYKVDKTVLARLVDERLLRKEPRLGSYYYELSHDRLTTPVLKSRTWHMPQHVRNRILTGVAIVLVLIGGASYYVIQLREERAQTLRARDETYQLISKTVFNLDHQLRTIDQLNLLEPIASDILKFYKQRVEDDSDTFTDNDWNAYAGAAITLGDIYSDEGKPNDALVLFEKSIKIWLRLSSQHPEVKYYGTNLQVAQDRKANIYSNRTKRSDLEIAKNIVEELLNIQLKKQETNPSDTTKASISYYRDKLGKIYMSLGDRDNAQENFTIALKLNNELVSKDPYNSDWKQSLGWSHINIGDLYGYDGHLKKAMKEFQKAKDIFKEETKRNPHFVYMKLGLGAAANRIGDIHLDRMDLEKSFDSYKELHDIFKELSDINPDKVDWQRDLMVSYSRLGDSFTVGFSQIGSLFANDTALAINKNHNYKEANVTKRYYDTELTRKYLLRAERFYKAALTITDRLVKKDSRNAEWQQDLADGYRNIGMIAEARGQIGQALKLYTEALDIARKLEQQNPDNTSTLRVLVSSEIRAGRIYTRMGNVAEAEKLFEQAHTHSQKAIENTGNENRWRSFLAASLDGLGDVAFIKANSTKAQGLYQNALNLRQELVKIAPDDAVWNFDLAVSYYKLGQLQGVMGQPTSRQNIRNSRRILDQLVTDKHLTLFAQDWYDRIVNQDLKQ